MLVSGDDFTNDRCGYEALVNDRIYTLDLYY